MKQLKICVLAFVLALTGCGGDSPLENDLSSANSSTGGNSGSGSVVGMWRYIYPSNGCEETFTFKSDGTFIHTSLDEVAGGTYTTSSTTVSGRYFLKMNYTYDNFGFDCSGFASDTSGAFYEEYYDIIANTLSFYNYVDDDIPVDTYEKVR